MGLGVDGGDTIGLAAAADTGSALAGAACLPAVFKAVGDAGLEAGIAIGLATFLAGVCTFTGD